MEVEHIYNTQVYDDLFHSINQARLQATVKDVRRIYETHLPELIEHLRQEHNFTGEPMNPMTLSHWVLGFLNNKSFLYKMEEFHHHIPEHIFSAGLPIILDMLNDMGADGKEWQRAIALLSLPFFTEHESV